MGKIAGKVRRLGHAYGQLIGILGAEAPVMVVLTFAAAVANGLLTPLGVFASRHVFDDGLRVAAGALTLERYVPYLVLFAACALVPTLISEVFIFGYAQPRSMLILRTAFRARMLHKLKKMRYEHLEAEESAEIIDKAYHRADQSARHMFPMYVFWSVSSLVQSVGLLWYFGSVRWWLPLAILAPLALQIPLESRRQMSIYDELEKYWKAERRYGILGEMLRSRETVKETRLFRSSPFLIDTYGRRLNARNREYEGYYLKHLRGVLLGGNITRLSTIAIATILLVLFLQGGMSVGIFIALSLQVFGGLYYTLRGSTTVLRASFYHINFFDYYDQYFALSDDRSGTVDELPASFEIEFRDVWFRYPGTDRDILKGLDFKVEAGEKASIVGENGEGKSTMVKLLLGLYEPDRGRILVGGRDLAELTPKAKTRIFGPVFQDFVRYSISLGENIGIGDVENVADSAKVRAAAAEGGADAFASGLEKGYQTLLGRDFEGGVDLSGGQWQRVALSRAFMGEKPVVILDEPTSQLDPMAESALYGEFAEMARGRTAVFITHRLASTMITDRILVIRGGVVTETGTHEELMARGDLYARMFEAQRQWYRGQAVEEAGHG